MKTRAHARPEFTLNWLDLAAAWNFGPLRLDAARQIAQTTLRRGDPHRAAHWFA